jgi:hypothetical protein
VLGRTNWLPPPFHPQASVAPPLVPSGGDTLARGEGAGGANSDEGTDTLVLYGSKEDSKRSGLERV